jgi:hypothetical protein
LLLIAPVATISGKHEVMKSLHEPLAVTKKPPILGFSKLQQALALAKLFPEPSS